MLYYQTWKEVTYTKSTGRRLRVNPYLFTGIAALCVLLVFCAAFFYVYNRTIDTYKENIYAQSMEAAQQNAEEIAGQFIDQTRLIDSFTKSTDYTYLVGLKNGIEKSYDFASLLQLHKMMSFYFVGSKIFYEAAILFEGETPFLCTSGYTSHDFRSDYENGLFSFGKMSYDEFMDLIHQYANNAYSYRISPAYVFSCTARRSQGIQTAFFIRKIRNVRGSANTYMLLFLNMDQLAYQISGYERSELPVFMNDSEHVIFSHMLPAEPETVEGVYGLIDRMGVTCFEAAVDYMDLHVLYGVSEDKLFQPLQSLSGVFRFLLITIIMLAAALFYAICRHWIMPLHRFSKSVEEKTDTRDIVSIRDVQNEWARLFAKSEDMQTYIHEIEPQFEKNLLLQLMENHYLSEEEKEKVRKIPVLANARCYLCAIVGNISHLQYRPEALLQTTRDIFLRCMPRNVFFPVNEKISAIVLALESDSNDVLCEIEQIFSDAVSEMNGRFLGNVEMAVGMGSVCEKLEEINMSYLSAMERFREAYIWHNAAVVTAQPERRSDLFYPLRYGDLEKIYHLLLSGNGNEACALLRELKERIFPKSSVGTQDNRGYQQFCDEIQGVLLRASRMEDAEGSIMVEMLPSTNLSLEDTLVHFEGQFQRVAEAVRGKRENSLDDLTVDMQEYLLEHFLDANLSLASVAEQFGMSEAGLSRYFKRSTGVNFFAYIENLRLSRAESLLLEEKLSARGVGQAVGYTTTETFYRAFKRKHGVPPKEWVVMIKGG